MASQEITNPFFPIYRIVNAGRDNREKFEATRDYPTPLFIDVELTNHCNLKCLMCENGAGIMRRERGFMPAAVAEAVADNLARFDIQGLRLVGFGENTLHPDFFPILEKFKRTGKLIHLHTNGVLFTGEFIEKLLALEIDSLKFSLQGATPARYAQMRRGGNMEKLADNIRLFHRLRGDRGQPYIQVMTTITDETEEEQRAFQEAFQPVSEMCNIGHTRLSHLDQTRMNLGPADSAFFRDQLAKESVGRKRHAVCQEIFLKLTVTWNGEVTICDKDFDNEMSLGNILDRTLPEIFRSEPAVKMRRVIADNNYELLPVCKFCYEYTAKQ